MLPYIAYMDPMGYADVARLLRMSHSESLLVQLRFPSVKVSYARRSCRPDMSDKLM